MQNSKGESETIISSRDLNTCGYPNRSSTFLPLYLLTLLSLLGMRSRLLNAYQALKVHYLHEACLFQDLFCMFYSNTHIIASHLEYLYIFACIFLKDLIQCLIFMYTCVHVPFRKKPFMGSLNFLHLSMCELFWYEGIKQSSILRKVF